MKPGLNAKIHLLAFRQAPKKQSQTIKVGRRAPFKSPAAETPFLKKPYEPNRFPYPIFIWTNLPFAISFPDKIPAILTLR
jgi:hypothetical protein